MLGYWSEGGSALRLRPDAWLETGDIGEPLRSCISCCIVNLDHVIVTCGQQHLP